MSAFPSIIYGTAWKAERTTNLVVKAVQQGFRAIDTACQPKHYREALVGDALQILDEKHNIKREDLFLQTKYTPIGGQDTSKPLPYSPSSPIKNQIRDSLGTSLKNLRTSTLDALLLHSPLPTPQQTLEAWTELIALRDEGTVKVIGVSNVYDTSLLAYLEDESGEKVEIVQNRWYERNGWDHEVVAYCKDEGIHYESFWTLSGSPSLLSHPAMIELASESNCTPAQAMFRIAQNMGITPLAGSTNEAHMRDGVSVQALAELDTELKKEVLKLMGVV